MKPLATKPFAMTLHALKLHEKKLHALKPRALTPHAMTRRELLGALIFAAAAPACSARDPRLLRIGIEAAYPPFMELGPDGQPRGFEIDLARAFFVRAGSPYELIQSDFAGLIPGLATGRFDAAMASINITAERRQRVDFSIPYYRTPACFVRRRSARDVAVTREGLAGRRVGVQSTTNLDDWLTRTWGGIAEIVRYPTQDALYLDLRAGRLDLMFSDLAAAQISLLRKPGGEPFEPIGPTFCDADVVGEGVAIALAKGRPELGDALDRAIREVRQSGEYARIQAKYFDFDLSCGEGA